MIGGFPIGSAPVASHPSYTQGAAGLVYGGDFLTGDRVFGGDTSAGEGIVVGGDAAVGVVYGGDERAG